MLPSSSNDSSDKGPRRKGHKKHRKDNKKTKHRKGNKKKHCKGKKKKPQTREVVELLTSSSLSSSDGSESLKLKKKPPPKTPAKKKPPPNGSGGGGDGFCFQASRESPDSRASGMESDRPTPSEHDRIIWMSTMDPYEYNVNSSTSKTTIKCKDCKEKGCKVQCKIVRGNGVLTRYQRGKHHHPPPDAISHASAKRSTKKARKELASHPVASSRQQYEWLRTARNPRNEPLAQALLHYAAAVVRNQKEQKTKGNAKYIPATIRAGAQAVRRWEDEVTADYDFLSIEGGVGEAVAGLIRAFFRNSGTVPTEYKFGVHSEKRRRGSK